MTSSDPLLLLGRDHTTPGAVHVVALSGGRTACAISVGGTGASPGAAAKRHPNEDALLALDAGPVVLLAVADAHHGLEASHFLLHRLAVALDGRPVHGPRGLEPLLRDLGDRDLEPDHPSATTLLVALLDRQSGQGTAWCWGDSTLVRLDEEGRAKVLTTKGGDYVHPAWPESLAIRPSVRVPFTAGPGGLLVAFTDGVDECHYGHPETSIGSPHLETLLARTGAAPEAYARALAELALAGVDGNPGGEDNLAIVVAAT